ncbi:MAG: sulfatase [Nocardioides sp.]
MRSPVARPRTALVTLVGAVAIGLLATGPSTSSAVAEDSPADGVMASTAPYDLTAPLGTAPDAAPAAITPATVAGRKVTRPNIVLVTTDDQTVGDMRWMPKTLRTLARQGVSFTRALSPHPLCCPARAAILTGQYAQNNGVKSNQDPFNFKALKTHTTLPVWLNRVGYQTAFTGKYLNGYGTKGKPQPGWDYWDAAMINPYSYVGYEMYQNGNQQFFKDLNNVDYINMRMNSLVETFSRKKNPFFIWASHVAPHGRLDKIKDIESTAEALPPTRFKNKFANVDSPSLRDPGYTRDRTSDKNSLVQKKNLPSKQKVNTVFRSRIRTLQAVDEGIVDLVRTLKRTGELANTYIIFTSDNGFLLGEHNLITKNLPYRQSLRVPMYIRGPGIPKSKVRSQRALMIDVAPTIADLAKAKPLVTTDGVSLMPTVRRNTPLRETVLIQAGPQTNEDLRYGWWWRGVTTNRYTYARFFANGIEELYDHLHDPSEINNVADDPRYMRVIAELRRRTQALVTCRGGAECSRSFAAVPNPL